MPGEIMFWGLLGAIVGFMGGEFASERTERFSRLLNPYAAAALGGVLGAVLGATVLSERPSYTPSPHLARVEDSRAFTELLSGSEGVLLVDFSSPTCPPCVRMLPAINGLADAYQGRALVVKVNTKKTPELNERYGIFALPTLVVFVDGEVAVRKTGYHSREELEKLVEEYLPRAEPEEGSSGAERPPDSTS